MDGVLRRMLIPSEALTARRAGSEAEKTKEGPLIRFDKNDIRNLGFKDNYKQTWWSITFREPAQKPPDEQRPIEIDPSSMSTLEAYFYLFHKLGLKCLGVLRTHRNIIKLGQTAPSPSNSAKRETLVED